MQREANSAAALRSDVASMRRTIENLRASVDAAEARHRTAVKEINNMQRALDTANANAQARDAELQQQIRSVYNDSIARMQRQAQATQQSIENLRVDFGNAIKDSIEANNRVIEQVINSNYRQLTGMINDLRAETNIAIANITTNLNTLNQGATNLLDSALDYMDQVQSLQNIISGTRHNLLLPGKYQSVIDLVNLAVSNIEIAQKNPMNASVARDKAREAFEESVRFIEDVAIAEQEWQSQRAVAEQISVVVAEQIENSRTIEPRPGVEVDVNYWANNGIDVNNEDYQGLAGKLKNPDNLTTEQLVDLQQAMLEVSRRVDETVADAYVRVGASQHMTRIAERIHRALHETGNLSVIDHSFEGNDKRGRYRFISRNTATGLTVVITVSAEEKDGNLNIKPESDIVNYGNMTVSDAEALVRDVMEEISGKENTRCTETSGNTVMHPERENLEAWRHSENVHQEPLVRPANKPQGNK